MALAADRVPGRAPMSTRRSFRRRVAGSVGWTVAALALVVIGVPTVWLVYGVVARAVPYWTWSVLTQPGAGASGGLENEILGTLLLVVGVVVLAGGVGVLSGIYLAEYASGRWGNLLRGGSEVLAGIPSIVLGYVGYIVLVVDFGWGFSLAAGLIVLSAMTVPYVAKSTELALRQVPTSFREGADALGMREGYSLLRISLRAALPGITTGLLVAIAIAMGETAPLLYTAGFTGSLPSLALTHKPVPFLTYAVWTFYNQPSNYAVHLSYDAALILVALVVALIVAARLVVVWTQRHADRRGGV